MSRSNILEGLEYYVYIYICMIVDAWKRVNWNGREGRERGRGRRFSRDREESMGPIRGEAKGGLVAVSESVSCSTAIDKIVTNGVP